MPLAARLNDKGTGTGKDHVTLLFCLELSNQVQRFFEVNFIRCFPT